MSEEFDIKDYLKKLKNTLEVKDLESFYVMVDRADFKPIKGYETTKKLLDMLSEKIHYYVGKRIADITLYTNINGIKKKEFIFSTKIVIYKILENGKLDTNKTLSIRINYDADDFEKRRFYLKDVEKFMRLCANKIIGTETLNGNSYKNILKMLKKKGIDFEE